MSGTYTQEKCGEGTECIRRGDIQPRFLSHMRKKAPLTIPLKTTKKEAIPFPWNHHPSEYRRCQYFYSVFVILPLWASAPTSLRKSHTLRIPYVKYSTGTNKTTRTVYRALGKPNQTAARRAFLEGRTIGEWHAESKCLFCASALFRPQRSFLPYLFCQDRKDMAAGGRFPCGKESGVESAPYGSIPFNGYDPRSGGCGFANRTAPPAHPKCTAGGKDIAPFFVAFTNFYGNLAVFLVYWKRGD